jgi:hypothetical protein
LEFRRALVALSLKPGASVARIAREHGINANQVFSCKRPAAPPVQQDQDCVEFGNGSSESIWLLGPVGRRSNTSASQRAGSSPLSLAVANKLWMAAARRPARSEPVNSQFFLPMAMGRMAFSIALLCVPC